MSHFHAVINLFVSVSFLFFVLREYTSLTRGYEVVEVLRTHHKKSNNSIDVTACVEHPVAKRRLLSLQHSDPLTSLTLSTPWHVVWRKLKYSSLLWSLRMNGRLVTTRLASQLSLCTISFSSDEAFMPLLFVVPEPRETLKQTWVSWMTWDKLFSLSVKFFNLMIK